MGKSFVEEYTKGIRISFLQFDVISLVTFQRIICICTEVVQII